MSKLYLAYGSNLNLNQMERRCPGAELLGYTYLQDTRLVFRGSKTGSYLSIEPALENAPRKVPCGVFRISKNDERALDIYEGFPEFYVKQQFKGLTLHSMDGKRMPGKFTGMAYALPVDHPLGAPSLSYWNVCMQGYDDFGFAPKILYQALLDSKE